MKLVTVSLAGSVMVLPGWFKELLLYVSADMYAFQTARGICFDDKAASARAVKAVLRSKGGVDASLGNTDSQAISSDGPNVSGKLPWLVMDPVHRSLLEQYAIAFPCVSLRMPRVAEDEVEAITALVRHRC